MTSKPGRSKSERMAEFVRRLLAGRPAGTFDEAYAQLSITLNEVEDELTGIPYNPATWRTDGRMYPPQADNVFEVSGRPEVRMLRSVKHRTYIGTKGAIEIRDIDHDRVMMSKPGADGRRVDEL